MAKESNKAVIHIIRTFVIAAVFFGASGSANAFLISDPGQTVAGTDYLSLSQKWWQWVTNIPTASNPLSDTNGSYAAINNSGPVFFVAGNVGGTSTRTFDVPLGKPIFFPLLTQIDIESPVAPPPYYDPRLPGSVNNALGNISPSIDNIFALFATLDGQPLLTAPTSQYRITSSEPTMFSPYTGFFGLNLPVDNLFGLPTGFYLPSNGSGAVTDGYWLALTGLSEGQHQLNFGGWWDSTGQNIVSVTATINVVSAPVPVPAAAWMFASALTGLIGFSRRKQHQY